MSSRTIAPALYEPMLDSSVAKLRKNADTWVELGLRDKITLLEQVRKLVREYARNWAQQSAEAKGIDVRSPWVGEEWLSGPWALAEALEGYISTLKQLAGGRKPTPVSTRTRRDGQLVAKVFPRTKFDWLLMNGISAEVWMELGVTSSNLHSETAVAYDSGSQRGEVALVLGGGNINSIPPLDALYELIADRRVVLLKMNPVNDYLAGVLRVIFAPLIDRGFLEIVSGGTDVGAYLTKHAGIDKVHITGSARSHDAIVYGSGSAGVERKQRDEPVLNKPITSELGGVSPVIVVPGPWSDADLAFHAENIATMKLHNTGANCIAAQVVVLPDEWQHSNALMDRLRSQFRSVPPRSVYYPGTGERMQSLIDQYPEGEVFGYGDQRRYLIAGLSSERDEYAFREEFFAPALATTSLPGQSAEAFLRNAVDFANTKLSGTLGATILIHPRTREELGAAFDDAIATLRYGAIGVNVWSAAAFLLSAGTWGAFPGHERNDIQSGSGVVHNALLFNRPQKTVVTGPFSPFPRSWMNGQWSFAPRPPWFVTNKTAHTTGERIAAFSVRPEWRKLPSIFVSALRG